MKTTNQKMMVMLFMFSMLLTELTAQTVQFESYNFPGSFIRHAYSRGRIDPNVNPFQDSEFRIVPGLADGNAISIESINFPGRYLRHKNGEIWLEAPDGTGWYNQDATWWLRSGIAGGGISFESYNFSGNYIRHRGGLLYSENPWGLPADATFHERPVNGGHMVDAFEGADPELTNFDGNYRIYVTNQAGVIRCMRPYDNNNLKGSWYATTAFTMPPHLIHGWAPAVVKRGNEYRMYFSAKDTRGPDENNIYVAFSNNPNSGFANEVEVVHDGAGGCTDVIDAGIDGDIIYYGGSFGGGAFMADLINNGRGSANHRRVNGLTNYSEAPYVGYVSGVGKVMLYARGYWWENSYGTNWATGDGQNWTYRGQVNFPVADQYLFRLGHASTINDYIAVNSNRAGNSPRRVAIGRLAVNGPFLEGNRSEGNSEEMTLTVVLEEVTDVEVVADFGIIGDNELKIYPNPVPNERFYIAFNASYEAESARIDIYDLSGSLVKTITRDHVEIGVNSYEINGLNLKSGQYILHVMNDRGESLGKEPFLVKD